MHKEKTPFWSGEKLFPLNWGCENGRVYAMPIATPGTPRYSTLDCLSMFVWFLKIHWGRDMQLGNAIAKEKTPVPSSLKSWQICSACNAKRSQSAHMHLRYIWDPWCSTRATMALHYLSIPLSDRCPCWQQGHFQGCFMAKDMELGIVSKGGKCHDFFPLDICWTYPKRGNYCVWKLLWEGKNHSNYRNIFHF